MFPPPPVTPLRRVVVTGLGLVTPLGCGVPHVWRRLLAGEHGLQSSLGCAAARAAGPAGAAAATVLRALPSRVAAIVPRGSRPGDFDVTRAVTNAEMRTAAPNAVAFALAAASEALADADLLERGPALSTAEDVRFGRLINSSIEADRFGVAMGSGIGNVHDVAAAANGLLLSPADLASGPAADSAVRRLSPFFVPRVLISMAAGHISIRFGLRGPSHAASTACASGAHSIGDAFRLVKHGYADAMVAGGTEACIGPLAMAGFCRARALATHFNDAPGDASRPFDSQRDGFVLGEGAGALVLEELDAALVRGARIYGEVRGFGLSSDAHHVTSPSEDGNGALRCMRSALAEGGLQAHDVDYVNAHATGTALGDAVEGAALGQLFSNLKAPSSVGLIAAEAPASPNYLDLRGCRGRALVSSTKGSVGHLLGAAGAIEAVFSLLALYTDTVPATRNLSHLSPDAPADTCDFVRAAPRSGTGLRAALSNSFGFGGVNASLLFTRVSSGERGCA